MCFAWMIVFNGLPADCAAAPSGSAGMCLASGFAEYAKFTVRVAPSLSADCKPLIRWDDGWSSWSSWRMSNYCQSLTSLIAGRQGSGRASGNHRATRQIRKARQGRDMKGESWCTNASHCCSSFLFLFVRFVLFKRLSVSFSSLTDGECIEEPPATYLCAVADQASDTRLKAAAALVKEAWTESGAAGL